MAQFIWNTFQQLLKRIAAPDNIHLPFYYVACWRYLVCGERDAKYFFAEQHAWVFQYPTAAHAIGR